MSYIDSHAHLTSLKFQGRLDENIMQANAEGIQFWLQGGIDPRDWQKQLELRAKHPGLLPVFGLHPYFVHETPIQECESALIQLSQQIQQATALGKLGLDLREPYLSSKAKQFDIFEAQLAIAKAAQKPIVLHLVRARNEFQIWLSQNQIDCPGIYHSFYGDFSYAKKILNSGLLISIGVGILQSNRFEKYSDFIKKIPFDRIVVETDSPDQIDLMLESEVLVNPLLNLFKVAELVGQIQGRTKEQVLSDSKRNLIREFSLDLLIS